MPYQQECKVISCEKINDNAYDLWIDAGELGRSARCGQFVNIKCGADKLLRRPISICYGEGEKLRLVFEIRGEGTAWLAQRSAGESIDVLGPLGHGFDVADKQVLFVGGGIGVPPLLWSAKNAKSTDAVLGFRDAGHAMLLPDFESICGNMEIMSDDGSIGTKGLVTLGVEKLLEANRYDAVCACGPKVMLRAVAALAERKNIPCQVSMEERMGCGVGACLVCACKIQDEKGEGHYKHVCKDGPVFDSKEVVWDD